jgi:hypothetical protein
MSSSKLALSFRIFQHGQLVREDTLTQGVIKIGKVPSAHLRIDDEAVSRMHAIVEITGSEISLIDLGSTRGTFVNGKRINKAMIQSGDVLQVGETRIELAVADAAPVLAVVPAAVAAAPPAAVPVAVAAAPAAAPPAAVPVAVAAAPAAAPPAAVPAAVAAAPAAALVGKPAAAFAATPGAAVGASAVAAAAVGAAASSAAAAAARMPAPPPVPVAAQRAGAPRVAAPAAEVRWAAEAPAGEPGARAVEVAAMLGDSVVHLKHCLDPRAGKVTLATWGFLAAGAACLLTSAVAFAASIRTAATNKDHLDRWTRVEHKPDYAFRPVRLGPGTDWAAFGGLALGLVGVTLGALRVRRERSDPYYRIGTAPGVQLATEHAPAPAFPLVAPSGDDFVFNYGAGIDGELIVDGVTTPLAELATTGRARPSALTAGALELAIPANGRIRARAGQTTFLVSSVARPRRHATPLFAGLERRALAYVAGSLAVHLGIWAFLQTVPPDASGANIDLPGSEDPTLRIRGVALADPPPEKPRLDQGDSGGDTVDTAVPMPLPSGAAGSLNAEHEARGKVARVADLDPQRAREEVIRQATVAGVLGSAMLMTSIKTLSDPSDFSTGFDTESIPGGIFGADGYGRGNFGNGLHGFDVGGGCTDGGPCGTIPSDGTNVGRLIGGLRKGTHYGLPTNGPLTMPGHQPILPHFSDAVVSGSDYSKSIIRRYIQRYKEQLGYCYEKQLLVHPQLSGQVTAQFFIGTTGAVQSASANGLDPEVSRCIAGVIGNIAFPPPRDGGVQVNYPFTFRPTSG